MPNEPDVSVLAWPSSLTPSREPANSVTCAPPRGFPAAMTVPCSQTPAAPNAAGGAPAAASAATAAATASAPVRVIMWPSLPERTRQLMPGSEKLVHHLALAGVLRVGRVLDARVEPRTVVEHAARVGEGLEPVPAVVLAHPGVADPAERQFGHQR